MLFIRFFIVLILLSPLQAWCAYDTEKIKNGISKQPAFEVSEWKKLDKEQSWVAKTQLKHVSISIGQKKSKFIAPYINPKQMKTAKHLCAEFAALAIEPATEDTLKTIKSTIKKATTRHQLKYMNMNGVKFSVAPKLIGAVVSLHCAVKSL